MADQHIVTCVRCGRRFDANLGYTYDRKSRRYTCPRCSNSSKKTSGSASKVTDKEVKIGGIVLKAVVGLIFFIAAFSSPADGWTIGYFLTAMVLALGCFAWAFFSYKGMRQAEVEKRRKEAAMRRAAAARIETKTCPSCGAITSGDICEYCGKKLP